MAEKTRPYWPEHLSATFSYLQGEQPLAAYLEQYGKQKPQETAYIFYGTVITWGNLLHYVNRFSHYLKRKGVCKGTCVALYLQNCPQYIIAHYAIQKLGGIVIPLNPMFKESELAYYLEEAPIEGIICGADGYPLVQKAVESTRPINFTVTTYYTDFLLEDSDWNFPKEYILPKMPHLDADDFYSILQTEQTFEDNEVLDIWNDIGLMVFTSGTTGRPKAAMLSFGNALFKTAAAAHANGMGNDEIFLAVAPLCHIAGMVMGLNTPVYSGRPCVLFTRFDPIDTVKAIERYKISFWYSIAPMNWAILQINGIENKNLSSLKTNLATSFGVQVTEQLAENWAAVTKGCVLYEAAYGLSETHTCDTFMPKNKIRYGSCGIPTYGTDIKILDIETGEEQPPGMQGEIVVKNPGVFKGYLNRPEATAETLKNGWVYTGDIGSFDEDGYLFFYGRMKEMIKSSGYSIFPEDVEALLNLHPDIKQSAVIGIPDPLKGEVVKAFVVLNDNSKTGITPDHIISWAKEQMAAYKYPRYVEIIKQLPATSSGKVLRKLLKDI